PLGEGLVPAEDFFVRLEPVQLGPRELVPKAERVAVGLIPELLVLLHRADAGLSRELGRRRKDPRLLHHVFDITASALRHGTKRWGEAWDRLPACQRVGQKSPNFRLGNAGCQTRREVAESLRD